MMKIAMKNGICTDLKSALIIQQPGLIALKVLSKELSICLLLPNFKATSESNRDKFSMAPKSNSSSIRKYSSSWTPNYRSETTITRLFVAISNTRQFSVSEKVIKSTKYSFCSLTFLLFFRSVGSRFDVGKSTLSAIFMRVVTALNEIFPEIIFWPNIEQRQRIALSFQASAGIEGIWCYRWNVYSYQGSKCKSGCLH